MASIVEEKKILRREFLQKRRLIEISERREAEKTICEHLEKLCCNELKPQIIAAYITDGTEVDLSSFIHTMMQRDIRICVPRFNSDSSTGGYEMVEINDLDQDLKLGKYDIMEPIDSCVALPREMYDKLLWLVPGVVFDEKCGRLGRGKGVYDQMISSSNGINIGIFYDCQKALSVPMADHDRSLDMIVTENGIYR